MRETCEQKAVRLLTSHRVVVVEARPGYSRTIVRGDCPDRSCPVKPPITRCATPRCPFLGRWAAGYCPACLPSTSPRGTR